MTACLAARVAVQKFCGAHYEYEYYYSVRVISRLMLARARQTLSKRREAPHQRDDGEEPNACSGDDRHMMLTATS